MNKYEEMATGMNKIEKVKACIRLLEIEGTYTGEMYELRSVVSFIVNGNTKEDIEKYIEENKKERGDQIEMSEEFSIVLTETKGQQIAYTGDEYAKYRDKYANAYEQEFRVSKQFETDYIITSSESFCDYKILYQSKYKVVEINNELVVVTEKEAALNNLKEVTLLLDRKKFEQTGIVGWIKVPGRTNTKMTHTHLRIPVKLRDDLKKEAKKRGIPMVQLIRDLMKPVTD